jgi:hypothetical protein
MSVSVKSATEYYYHASDADTSTVVESGIGGREGSHLGGECSISLISRTYAVTG